MENKTPTTDNQKSADNTHNKGPLTDQQRKDAANDSDSKPSTDKDEARKQ